MALRLRRKRLSRSAETMQGLGSIVAHGEIEYVW